MEVQTREASIDTIAVTIQALRVSGKQMTLAVFRQLPMHSIYKPDGTLCKAQLWGTVRYDFSKEGCGFWVVASVDGLLFRGPVASGFYSVERVLRSLDECDRNLRDYAAWVEHNAVQDEASKNGEGHTVPYMPSPYVWNEKQEQEILQDIVAYKVDLENAKRAAVSLDVVRALPQLFIAV